MKVVVLGGGPAGLNAAVRARELGAEVTLIERRRLGGTSLNEGAAPVRKPARAVTAWLPWCATMLCRVR